MTLDESLRALASLCAGDEPVLLQDHLVGYDLAQTPAERQHEQRLVALGLVPWLMRSRTELTARADGIAEYEGAKA